VWRIRNEQDCGPVDEVAPFELHHRFKVPGPANTKRKLNKSAGRRAKITNEGQQAYQIH
jgi:hypothetical protein